MRSICFCHFSAFSFSRQFFGGCHRSFSSPMTPLFLSFSLLLIYSQFASPTNAFILQELPLYRNVRNQRHATPPIGPSKPSIDYGIRRSTVSMPLVIRIEDGMPTIFVRPSRAFNFHRLNRLQEFWHRNEALRRLTQTGNRP